MKYIVIYTGRNNAEHRCTVEADCEVNAINRVFRDCPEDIKRHIHNVRCEEIPCLNLDYIRVLTGGCLP